MLGRGGIAAAGLNAGAGALAGDVAGALTSGVLAFGAFFATLRFAAALAGLRADAFFAVRFLAAGFAPFFLVLRAATAFFAPFLVFLAFVFALFAMIVLPIVRGESSIAQYTRE